MHSVLFAPTGAQDHSQRFPCADGRLATDELVTNNDVKVLLELLKERYEVKSKNQKKKPLLEHIKKRGRGYEDSIDPNYLTNLNDRYEEWIKNYTAGNLLILDIDSRNFKENPEDFKWVVEQIDEQLAKIK